MDQNEHAWLASTINSLLDARKKGRRLGYPKSRSGCITCKVRRVKCDETHPACTRCTGTGRRCDGYTHSDILPAATDNNTPGRSLSKRLCLTDRDKHAFTFFVSRAAPCLTSSMDTDFWCRYILQVSQAHQFVMDSLLAISTLYEYPQYFRSFQVGDVTCQSAGKSITIAELDKMDQITPQRLDEHHAYALKAYNNAIHSFRGSMTAGEITPVLAITSCVLFICIELIRDNVFAALTLVTKGTHLLQQFASLQFESEQQHLMITMQQIFSRLSVLMTTMGHTQEIRLAQQPVNFEYHTFSSLADARTALFSLMADSQPFLQDATEYQESIVPSASIRMSKHNSAANENATENVRSSHEGDVNEGGCANAYTTNVPLKLHNDLYAQSRRLSGLIDVDILGNESSSVSAWPQDPYAIIRPGKVRRQIHDAADTDRTNLQDRSLLSIYELRDQQWQLEHRLMRWRKGYERAHLLSQDTELKAATSLLMYYHVSLIWITTRLAPNQYVFEQFTYDFERILHYAELYVGTNTRETPAFTFEVGVVQPLFFVATKCRVPSLRRRALQLLGKAPMKECTWGANTTAQLAARLVAIEEERIGLPLPTWNGAPASVPVLPVDDTKLPSQSDRICCTEILKNMRRKGFDLRITRVREESGQLWMTVQDYSM